jgi:ABC-type Na+ efflux pump permease subunit
LLSKSPTTKGGIVTVRWLIIGVGAVLLIAGVIGLLAPVSISDGNGHSIGCGNAVATDLSAARSANNTSVANIPILNQVVPHTDYVAQCQSSVGSRRTWSIPLAVLGLIAVAGAVLTGRQGAPRSGL